MVKPEQCYLKMTFSEFFLFYLAFSILLVTVRKNSKIQGSSVAFRCRQKTLIRAKLMKIEVTSVVRVKSTADHNDKIIMTLEILLK